MNKFTINTSDKTLYYVDRQGVVQKDVASGKLAGLARLIKSLWRDYRVFNVHRALNSKPQTHLTSEDTHLICSKVAKKCGITTSQYEALAEMSRGTYTGLSSFFSEIRGNKKFNAQLKVLTKQTKSLTTVSEKVLQEVSTFSYKTTMEKELIRVAQKADLVREKYLDRQEASDPEKLTIAEVRSLESLAKMKPYLDKIATPQTPADDLMKEIRDAASTADKFIETMLEDAEREAPAQPGTFILYDLENDYKLRGQKVSGIQRFFYKYFLKTNITHIAAGFKGDDNKDWEAHMWGSPVSKYTLSRRTLGNRCFKTIQLHPEKMIDKAKMEKLYGTDWKETLHQKYAEVAQSYYKTNPELKQLYNPSFKRVRAALGFRFSLVKKTWEERSEFPKSRQVICSEFAVLSSLQCLKQVNELIDADWKAKKFEDAPPKLHPPVRENRRLNRLIPHEIVQRAIGEGTAEIVQPASCIQKVIHFKNDALLY